ncbi:hypothetical protein [Actinomycetospora termitidis]|uniref:DUF3995 domain-containing protein n=1 Tax=Actinomycetospora termitidis TaxID=3053470 RepID=A0ABT7MIM2_9PSEU|nr:hypothetical protein [Actinomycetospora sp. Odt1-22]MDL5159752.1 hypothetical protein [Actinomycetospora sp. Odt1-22]
MAVQQRRRERRPVDVRAWGVALAVWCLVFAVPHVAWALGSRAGLGGETAAADAALSTGWFATYNAVTAVLALAGVVVGLATALGPAGRHLAPRWWPRVLLGVAVLLVLRGLVGLTGLVIDLLGSGITSPPVLVAIEPWFVLGGVACAGLARAIRRSRGSIRSKGTTSRSRPRR